jgi:hypothetical protein
MLYFTMQNRKKAQNSRGDMKQPDNLKPALTDEVDSDNLNTVAYEEYKKAYSRGTPAANNDNSGIMESPKEPEAAAPAAEKPQSPSRPEVLSWKDIVTPSNQRAQEQKKINDVPVVPQEPVIKAPEEPKKVYSPSGATTTAAINQKTSEKPKKASRAAVRQQEIAKKKAASTVKDEQAAVKAAAQFPAAVETDPTTAAEIQEELLTQPEIVKEENVMPVLQEPASHELEVMPVMETQVQISEHAEPEPVMAEMKSAPASTPLVESLKSEFIKELEANLAVATSPWSDHLQSFQTKCWDEKHGQYEPLLSDHHQELIQLYVDIGLANNIVWLATEIGHRSKELDDSYIKLCSSISESIKRIVPSLNNIV